MFLQRFTVRTILICYVSVLIVLTVRAPPREPVAGGHGGEGEVRAEGVERLYRIQREGVN